MFLSASLVLRGGDGGESGEKIAVMGHFRFLHGDRFKRTLQLAESSAFGNNFQ